MELISFFGLNILCYFKLETFPIIEQKDGHAQKGWVCSISWSWKSHWILTLFRLGGGGGGEGLMPAPTLNSSQF